LWTGLLSVCLVERFWSRKLGEAGRFHN